MPTLCKCPSQITLKSNKYLSQVNSHVKSLFAHILTYVIVLPTRRLWSSEELGEEKREAQMAAARWERKKKIFFSHVMHFAHSGKTPISLPNNAEHTKKQILTQYWRMLCFLRNIFRAFEAPSMCINWLVGWLIWANWTHTGIKFQQVALSEHIVQALKVKLIPLSAEPTIDWEVFFLCYYLIIERVKNTVKAVYLKAAFQEN